MSDKMEIIKLQQESIRLLQESVKHLLDAIKQGNARMDMIQMQINNIRLNNGDEE